MSDTAPLHYVSRGPADAPTVFLGGSVGTDWQLWQPQLDELGQQFRLVAFDTRGHGRSPVVGHTVTVADLAADVLALADQLGVASFGYCGLSIGGAIGQVLAADHPDRVTGLVLCCTAARFGDPAQWRDRAARVRAEGMGWLVDVCRERWFAPGFADREPATARHVLAVLQATDPTGYAACCDALAAFDGRPLLPRITAPTLVLAGADDVATPVPYSEELAAGIRAAELTVVPDAGHLATLERPDVTTAAIRAHLAEHQT